jgi:catechol 2,3-dioxygenase-like lactoylglutathione lyase family enzyme
MERSIRFYEQLGFSKSNDFTLDDPRLGEAFGLDVRRLRGVFMRLGDDAEAPALDLVQFIDPPSVGEPYSSLNNIGICRIAFTVDDIDKTCAALEKMKVQFVAPLTKMEGPDGGEIGVACIKDPDGTILEIIHGM